MIRYRIVSLFMIIIILCGAVMDTSPAHAARERKPKIEAVAKGEAFALMDPRDTAADFQRYLALPDIDGIAIRTTWSDLEPQDNQYNWSVIDEALSAANSAQKKVTLHIIASAYASPPLWLSDQGVEFYNESNPLQPQAPATQQAVPWDTVFITKWGEFLVALSAHIVQTGQMSSLSRISIGVPVPEMSLIACRNDYIGGALPYSRRHYLNAWRSSIKAMDSAFPTVHKIVSAPVSQICAPDNDGARFYSDILDYMREVGDQGFGIYATDLNAAGSARLDNLARIIRNKPVSFQFIGSYSDDARNRFGGSLSDAICKGHRLYGSSYFEVYKQDIDNKSGPVQQAIGMIHHLDQCP